MNELELYSTQSDVRLILDRDVLRLQDAMGPIGYPLSLADKKQLVVALLYTIPYEEERDHAAYTYGQADMQNSYSQASNGTGRYYWFNGENGPVNQTNTLNEPNTGQAFGSNINPLMRG